MNYIIIPIGHVIPELRDSASERIRCNWLLKYLPATKYDGTQNLDEVITMLRQLNEAWREISNENISHPCIYLNKYLIFLN